MSTATRAPAGALRAAQSWYAELVEGQREPRLEVVPSRGGQSPLVAQVGEVQVVFEGVLYNPDDIRALCGSSSDNPAHLIAHTYHRLGENTFAHLKGRYVVLVLDKPRGELLAARDRMGVYPLFYADGGDGLLLSSSIPTLVDHPRGPRGVNRALLAEHLHYRWTERDETYVAGVRRVRANYVLRVKARGRQISRYWHPVRGGNVPWATPDELAGFGDVLEQAVGRAIGGSAASICLSGGIDSVSVACAASDYTSRKGLPTPWALSVGFPDPDRMLDEIALQKAVAGELEFPQIFMDLDDALGHRGLLPSTLELAPSWPVPLIGIFSPAYFTLIEQAKSKGCTVVMTGAGGDEWLAVSPSYSADLLAQGRIHDFVRFWSGYKSSYRVPAHRLLRRLIWRFGVREILLDSEHRLLSRVAPDILAAQARWRIGRATYPWIAPDPSLRRELDERATAAKLAPRPRRGQTYLSEMESAFEHPLLAMDLEEAWEKGRRLGVEILMPYYDQDLVELLCWTPPEALFEGGRSKSPARRLVNKRLPTLGFGGQKKITSGNFWPQKEHEAIAAWYRSPDLPALSELGIVDRKLLGDYVDKRLRSGDPVFAYYVWELLNLERWVEARL